MGGRQYHHILTTVHLALDSFRLAQGVLHYSYFWFVCSAPVANIHCSVDWHCVEKARPDCHRKSWVFKSLVFAIFLHEQFDFNILIHQMNLGMS